MNKKALYEKIMSNVSKEVKKALNESLSDTNIAYYQNPIESTYIIGKLLRNILDLSSYLVKMLNKNTVSVKPCVVFTFKSFFLFPDKLEKLISWDEGYSFTTESGVVVLALYLEDIDNIYLIADLEILLLKFMSRMFQSMTTNIKYNTYFGLYANNADNEDYISTVQFLKELFDDTINMTNIKKGLTCVKTDGESYNKFVNVANEIDKHVSEVNRNNKKKKK